MAAGEERTPVSLPTSPAAKEVPRMATDSANSRVAAVCFRAAVVALTAVLDVTSCFLPATSIGSLGAGDGPSLGLEHLLFGFLTGDQGLPAWSANFVLWVAVVCLLRSCFRAAAVLGIAAAVLGLTTLTAFKSDGKYSGYYLWQSSQIVFAVGAVVAYRWSRAGRIAGEPAAAPARPRE